MADTQAIPASDAWIEVSDGLIYQLFWAIMLQYPSMVGLDVL